MTHSVNRKDIQGILASGYDHLSYVRFVFLKIVDTDKARKWLSVITPLITNAQYPETHKPGACLNFAVSWKGLEKLGVDGLLEDCPHEFVRGMNTDEARRSWANRRLSNKWEYGRERGRTSPPAAFALRENPSELQDRCIKTSVVSIKEPAIRTVWRSSRKRIQFARKMTTRSPLASATVFLNPP